MKCHWQRILNSFVVGLLLLSATAKLAYANQIDTLTYGLLQLGHDDDRCSVVKIHSVVTNEKGQSFKQSGMGWIVVSASAGVGILTPFHVVAEASAVFAECNGNLFNLIPKKVNAEKDLAFLEVEHEDYDKLRNLIFPLVWEFSDHETTYRQKLTKEAATLIGIVSPEVPVSEFKNNMKALALTMASFGIASALEAANRSSSLILSPDLDNTVEPIIVENDPFAKALIRLDGLGVRPGLSGSVLFGVLPDQRLIHNDFSKGTVTRNYALSVQHMPKILLGMVTKTRLNGSETVAISMADIIDFIETLNHQNPATHDLKVSFQRVEKGDDLELIPVLTLGGTPFVEYCGDSYKNSGNLTPLIEKTVVPEKKAWFQFSTPAPPMPVDNKVLERFDKLDKTKPVFQELKTKPNLKDFDFKSIRGGGDYGEGGDGFSNPQAEFFLSSMEAFKLEGMRDDFKEIKKYQTQGIYRIKNNCKQEVLAFENKLVSAVNIPGKEPERMVTFEDLRAFVSKHGPQSLQLIRAYSSNETNWPYSQLEGLSKPLRIPLMAAHELQRTRGNNFVNSTFFQEKFLAIKASDKEKSFLSIEKTGFETFVEDGNWRLYLNSNNNNWKGNIQFSESCRVNLQPEKFKVVNAWKSTYEDQNIQLSVSIGAMDEFLRLNVTRLSACADNRNLILGQFIIYSSAGLAPVVGSTRTALIPMPMDLETLRKRIEGAEKP